MEEKVSIGILGGGFIGSAISQVFSYYTDVKLYDKQPARSLNNLQDTVAQDVIFVCVNTPMDSNGRADVSILRNALEDVRANSTSWKAVIVKSTVPPLEMEKLIEEFQEELYLIFSPEFLTARCSVYDMQQCTRFIFGTKDSEANAPRNLVDHLFHMRFPAVPRYWVDYKCASLVKYFTNIFFCTKVATFNEFKQVADALGVDWDEVCSLTILDHRIGRSHFQVPGNDGSLGFGGTCFYKDINAYRRLVEEAGIQPQMAEAAWNKNIEVRGAAKIAEDLCKMKGIAATTEFTLEDVRNL